VGRQHITNECRLRSLRPLRGSASNAKSATRSTTGFGEASATPIRVHGGRPALPSCPSASRRAAARYETGLLAGRAVLFDPV